MSKKRKSKAKPLPIEFSQPIYLGDPPSAASFYDGAEGFEKETRERNKKVESWWYEALSDAELEKWRKLKRLAEHIGLSFDRNDGWKLALFLAERSLPGFKVLTKRDVGAKNKWDELLSAKLANEVRRYQKNHPSHSVATACRHLIKEKPWKDMNITIRTLTNRHSEWKQRFWRFRYYVELAAAGKSAEELADWLVATNSLTEMTPPGY